MSIAEKINSIQNQIRNHHCQLVAVGKTKPVTTLIEAYETGIRDFGENKVQELIDKYEQMPKDIRWHMIGHLQRNKVKYVVPFVHLIHAVDSVRLLSEIEKQASKIERPVNCLLQIHIAEEESKFGLSEDELFELLYSQDFLQCQYVRVIGLMGMATFTKDTKQVRKEFRTLKQLFEKVKERKDLPSHVQMQELSMGMSSDYSVALEEGSSMIRIGTTIFGSRN